MTTRAARWRLARERAAARKPWLRLDAVRVVELENRSGYQVIIEGVHLRPVISPPAVRVGDQAVRQLTFAPDGRSLRGVVPRRPTSLHTVVEYGFARAEFRGETA